MKTIPTVSSASIWTGFWFVFNDEKLQFAFWASPLGKEELYVNGRLVSQCRRISRSGVHVHTEGDVVYELSGQVTSVARGELECSLKRSGILLGSLSTKLVLLSRWLRIAFVACIGVPMLYAIMNGAPLWPGIMMMVPGAFLVYKFAGGYRFTP